MLKDNRNFIKIDTRVHRGKEVFTSVYQNWVQKPSDTSIKVVYGLLFIELIFNEIRDFISPGKFLNQKEGFNYRKNHLLYIKILNFIYNTILYL